MIYWKPKFQRILSKGHWHDSGEILVEEKQTEDNLIEKRTEEDFENLVSLLTFISGR